jgi:outer membrane receptor protein involved in Fe transport
LDYFNIKVNNVIDAIGSDNILNYCLNGITQFCSMVHRSSTGSLWTSPSGYIDDPTLNLGSRQTKGIDLSSNYVLDMAGAGQLTFNFNGTYTMNLITNPVPGLGKYDCAGLYGNSCNNPTPKWRHKFRTSWATPIKGWDVSLQWRHINEVKLDTTSSNPLLAGSVPATDAKLGSREYFDLSTSYVVTKGVSARLGINNVLDKDPPIIGGGDFGGIYVNGNTYPQIYDTLGRYVFINVTVDF